MFPNGMLSKFYIPLPGHIPLTRKCTVYKVCAIYNYILKTYIFHPKKGKIISPRGTEQFVV